jgi:hypothetical protein
MADALEADSLPAGTGRAAHRGEWFTENVASVLDAADRTRR